MLCFCHDLQGTGTFSVAKRFPKGAPCWTGSSSLQYLYFFIEFSYGMSCRFQTFQAFGIIPRSFASWVGFLMDSPRKDGYKLGRWDWRYTMAVVISALLFQALEINRSCSSSKLSGYISPRKGRHQGPQITYLQFC
jgi:hypothetical protein